MVTQPHQVNGLALARRGFLKMLGLMGAAGVLTGDAIRAIAADMVELPFANGARRVEAFAQKRPLILLRTRPPLLETPMAVFNQGVFTPNDAFYVRWHLADIPTEINVDTYRLRVFGHVNSPMDIHLGDLVRDFAPFEIAAVNQCSGNSRGFFSPRVPGGEWGNGAMGNALWTGIRLKHLLAQANPRPGARFVRFNGLDKGTQPNTPDFLKSLDIDHAMDGEVMIAYGMNHQPLPMLNGFPLRLVVPGWFATYWVKSLSDIEVLDHPDDNFWMKGAYLVPDTPEANMKPGQAGVKMVPINRMGPRSFITSFKDGDTARLGRRLSIGGIAFGGDTAVGKVMFSSDGGGKWQETQLDKDYGKYSFRRFQTDFTPAQKGSAALMVKAINSDGIAQPMEANWNPSGYARNVVEQIKVRVV
jgi:DMSO/TMAO reductase YedYZ molybdopterin-dependent catalytic subunit